VSQIHIAQGLTPESMTVSWITKSDAKSEIRYGLSQNDLKFSATGYTSSYKFDYPNFGVYESGVIHHVHIKDILPGTIYFYQCGDFSLDETSGLEVFRTVPKVGDTKPFTFAVIGDLGQTSDSASTIAHVVGNRNLGMVLHAGDLSYADCNQTLWDSYGELVEVLAKERPWMVGPGNHEIEYTSDGGAFVAFEERYKMPAVAPMEYGAITIPPQKDSSGNPYCSPSVFQAEYNYGNSFFSFDAASAHVIYLNPYSVSNSTSVQYQWLEKDLLSVNRAVTPWVVVVMHCPWYNSNQAHYGELQAVLMRDSMEELLYRHHVNIVFGGHVHAYERTFPIFQNETRNDGVVFVTIGDGGNREGHAATYHPLPSWSAYRNGTQYGHGELTLASKDKMVWRWLRNVDGQIVSMDEMVVCNSAFGSVFC